MAISNSNKTLTVREDSGIHSGNLVDDVSYTISGYSIQGEGGPFVLDEVYTVDGKGDIQINTDGSYSFESEVNWFGVFPAVIITVTDGVDEVNSTFQATVTSVSDAPVGQDVSIFILEDSVYSFSPGDFPITDIDGDALKSIKVKTLPARGTLKYGSANVIADQAISIDNIGLLSFTPAANGYGSPYASFTFSVIDEGSLSNTGVIESVSNYTATINVIAVNDEPSAVEGGWINGDFERILLALEIGIGEYTLNEMRVCANRLSQISNTLVSRVRVLLDEYDAAVELQKTLGVGSDSGKTLIKADVLEWEVDKGGRQDAVQREKGRIYNELVKIFSYCPIIINGVGRSGVSLIRS